MEGSDCRSSHPRNEWPLARSRGLPEAAKRRGGASKPNIENHPSTQSTSGLWRLAVQQRILMERIDFVAATHPRWVSARRPREKLSTQTDSTQGSRRVEPETWAPAARRG